MSQYDSEFPKNHLKVTKSSLLRRNSSKNDHLFSHKEFTTCKYVNIPSIPKKKNLSEKYKESPLKLTAVSPKNLKN
jgi:hypothetical protein